MTIKTVEQYLKAPYSYSFIQDEDGTFAAEVLEFEGCYSQGETPEQAMNNIQEAAKNWIEATLRSGKPIPTPLAETEASGKYALRMPKHIHQKVQRMAQNDGVSVNTFLVEAIAEKIGAIDYQDRLMTHIENKMSHRTVANIAALLLPSLNFDVAHKRANTGQSFGEQHSKGIVIQINP